MVKILFIFIYYYVICSFSGNLFSCDEKEVGNIKIATDSINGSIDKCTHIKKEPNKSEMITAHYLDDKLVKITVEGNQKGSSKNYELYFRDGLIIYIYAYEKKHLSEGMKKESNYYYFKDNKMVCWQKNDLTYAIEDEKYYSKEKSMLIKADSYLSAIQ